MSVSTVSRINNHYSNGYRSYSESESETKTGVGVLAGVGVNVTDNITVDAGYRYNYWGNYEFTKLHTHELSAGVRVKF